MTIIDASATKVFEDQMLVVDTYGNASAQHAFDLDTGEQDVNVVNWRGVQPSSLLSGRVDVRVGVMATAVLTANAIAANAIGASELATDAAQEIADEIFRMTTATIEAAGGGVPDARTLYGVIGALMHKHERDAADNNIVLYQSDDVTVLVTIPITKSSTLDPIKTIDPP